MYLMDNQNKTEWCKRGEQLEQEFVKSCNIFGWRVDMNPQKKKDKYTHDFLVQCPADLKTMQTKWIKAKELFGIDSEYAISINEKDFRRYSELYPNIVILCDVRWLGKVFSLTIPRARYLISEEKAHRHEYLDRRNDNKGNAKVSWVFNVNDLDELIVKL